MTLKTYLKLTDFFPLGIPIYVFDEYLYDISTVGQYMNYLIEKIEYNEHSTPDIYLSYENPNVETEECYNLKNFKKLLDDKLKVHMSPKFYCNEEAIIEKIKYDYDEGMFYVF